MDSGETLDTNNKMNFKLKHVASSIAAIAMAGLVFTSCGSGGGGDDGEDKVTIRPKTLDGVSLVMQGSVVAFEFIRGQSSGKAINDGDVETGSFFYGYRGHTMPNTEGLKFPIDVMWPYTIGPATYTYTPTNETSGEIILRSSGFFFDDLAGFGNSEFNHSYFSNEHTPSSIRMLVTFESSGSVISHVSVRMEDPEVPWIDSGDPDIPDFSSTTLSAGSATVGGAPLPVNYNPQDGGFEQHSKISAVKIGGYNVEFVDAVDPAKSFSLQLTSLIEDVDYDDVGQTTYRDSDGDMVVSAAGYTYARIIETDNASLVMTGGTPQDGTTVLTFLSSGAIATQNYAGTYVTPNGDAGTFVMYPFLPTAN